MTQDEIIEMARDANLEEAVPGLFYVSKDGLSRFAVLVAEKECEACAQIADSMPRVWDVNAPDPQQRIASAIRAKGQA